VLVCQAAGEHFNPGQAEKLASALGDLATLRSFTAAESAAVHSHIGAFVLMNGVVLDWLTETLGAPQRNEGRRGHEHDCDFFASESGDTAWDYELVLEISRSMALASILRMRATRTRQEVRE
jgi:hypothetical protein